MPLQIHLSKQLSLAVNISTSCSLTKRAPDPDKVRRDHDGRSLRVFRQFAWLEVDFVKMALSHPTHQRVTRAVRRLIATLEAKSIR